MKKLGCVLLTLGVFIIAANFLKAEDVRYRRPLRIDQTWSRAFFNDLAFDGNAQDTSGAVYVGDIYLPSLTYFYKGDDNTTGGVSGDSLDVNMSPDFWVPGVGWVSQDHPSIQRMDNTSWKIFHDRAPPRIVAASISNPSAGADFTTTTSTNVDDAIFAVSFALTTSDSVANRYVRLYFKDVSGNIISAGMPTTAQPASKSIAYSFFPGAVDAYTQTAAFSTAPIPPNIRLRYGSTIYTDILNIDEVDQISSISLSSLRDVDISVGWHTPDMADSIRFVADAQADNGSDCDIYLIATAMFLRVE